MKRIDVGDLDGDGWDDLVMGDYQSNHEITVLLNQFSTITGDVDRDGDVDLMDLLALLWSYGSVENDSHYDPHADFDGNGEVALTDLAALLGNYGVGRR